MVKGKFNIVIGGQAGSEAKGKLSAFLVDKFQPDILTMTSSPNAGHTVVVDGRKIVTYHLPAGAAMAASPARVVLGPASVINPAILLDELQALTKFGRRLNLVIDPRATVITPTMIKGEKGFTKIGSTAQGVGLARIARIKRIGITRMKDIWDSIADLSDIHHEMVLADASIGIHSAMLAGATVLHECTQGFDLCLDHGIDPQYCTTRNITTAGALADFGIPPRKLGHVYGVIRPYPIRVNNRDGSSGPYAEAEEITWNEVKNRCGSPIDLTEMTTTTKLQRRVFEFCRSRFDKFMQVCDPDYLCLQFANYLNWSIWQQHAKWGGMEDQDKLPKEVRGFITRLAHSVAYIGTGPEQRHMIDTGIDKWRG